MLMLFIEFPRYFISSIFFSFLFGLSFILQTNTNTKHRALMDAIPAHYGTHHLSLIVTKRKCFVMFNILKL